MVKAVRSGVLPPEPALSQAGPIFHSRWLTTGCVLPRLWVVDHSLTGELLLRLERLVSYVRFKLLLPSLVPHEDEEWLAGRTPAHLTALRCVRQGDQMAWDAVEPYVRCGAEPVPAPQKNHMVVSAPSLGNFFQRRMMS